MYCIQQLADTSDDVCPEDLNIFTTEQEQHWIDATTDECLDEAQDVPAATDEGLDLAMVYDIHQAVSRLVGKAPQLIGRLRH